MLSLPSRFFLEAVAGDHLLQRSVLTPVQEAGLKGDGRAPHGGVWPVWGQTLSAYGEDNVCPLCLPAQQWVAPSKCCSGRAGGTGAHPSPGTGLRRAVPSSCSRPRGSCPQDPKGTLLPFCQDSLDPKGKDKWQERGQKALQGLWALPGAQGCSFCRGWELGSVLSIPSRARAGESQGAAATLITLPWPGLGSGRAQIPLVSA